MKDFFITHKHEDSGRITHLKVQANRNEKPDGQSFEWKREDVIDSIESKTNQKHFQTWYSNKVGAKVEVVKVNGNKYLRTDRNETPKDNLENLPNF
jgi:fructose-1,6-bisphosphatase